MKTIGLLGGMSWESTGLYYRLINQETRRRLGGLHSAPIAMVSVDFQPIEELQHRGDWPAATEILIRHAQQVEAAGADFLLICTNTMHKIAPQVEAAIDIPLLHIADATAKATHDDGLSSIGLLGTRFTMEQNFFRKRLEQHGFQVLIPAAEDRELLHRIIYDELCLGIVRETSRDTLLRIISDLNCSGAEGTVAGCTEIGMLIQQEHLATPLFDTTVIHALAAVSEALR
ncbi:MAG: aspartate racemase [Desulfuromonas sp.]|nr:MAG: aspartate racemase [Desulfuromonas sp.]